MEARVCMSILSRPWCPTGLDEASSSSDRWFAALDQRLIDTGAERWRARVVGIHEEDGELWIQIAAEGKPDCDLVIHCWRWQPVDQVLGALRRAHRPGVRLAPRIVDALQPA